MANTMQWLQKEAKKVEKVEKAQKVKTILFVDSLIPLSEPDSDGPDQLIAAHHILTTSKS